MSTPPKHLSIQPQFQIPRNNPGSIVLGKEHSAMLSNRRLVPEYNIIPRHLQERQYLFHLRVGVENELFVVDGQTSVWSGGHTVRIHGRKDTVPIGQSSTVSLEVKPFDSHPSGYDRMDRSSTVPDHQDKLWVGENSQEANSRSKSERVFIA